MIAIAGHPIGPEHKPFTIAEVGLNHNGDLGRARAMIRIAKECGVDAVKFQTFKAEGVCDDRQLYTYRQYDTSGTRLVEITQPRIDIFRSCELPGRAWPMLKDECDAQGIVFLSTPQNPSDLDILLRVGIPAIKIGSDDLTNQDMLRYCARDDVGLPLILSCGMSDMVDVARALHITRRDNTVMLVCTSQYPCPPKEANLRRIGELARWMHIPVGFSDHTMGSTAAVAAVALGACVFETHFTLDETLPGPDHWWAKTPEGLTEWVTAIREAHTMLGSGEVAPSAAELEMKRRYQRKETR